MRCPVLWEQYKYRTIYKIIHFLSNKDFQGDVLGSVPYEELSCAKLCILESNYRLKWHSEV